MGIEKDFLDYRIQPHIFIGINFYYTKYSGVYNSYNTSPWGWAPESKFNIKTLGIGLLINPGIRLKINDKISMILESSLGINNNIKTYKKDYISLEKLELKINPIETLVINYRFDLK